MAVAAIEDFVTEAVLIFKCAECGDIHVVTGFEDVFLMTEPQESAESRKLHCGKCLDR